MGCQTDRIATWSSGPGQLEMLHKPPPADTTARSPFSYYWQHALFIGFQSHVTIVATVDFIVTIFVKNVPLLCMVDCFVHC